MAEDTKRSLLAALGPGVLFTGTAVGVSHLVQSTRAGALYGLGLLGVVLVAHLLKYPAFRFGPHYAAATGRSLLDGYARIGRWALVLYGVVTVGTMFTVQAAVTLFTAGMVHALFGLSSSPVWTSALIMVVCAALTGRGGYRWLDLAGKVVVGFLAVSTLVATALILPRVPFDTAVPPAPSAIDVAFLVAFVGWMPSAIDVSIWQSLWTVARAEERGVKPNVHDSVLDFHLGYAATAFLALCFVVLGAAVLYGSGVTLEARPGAFAGQVIAVYSEALGAWSRPFIGAAAVATMFSTTLTVVDGFPRALAALWARLYRPELERPDLARTRVDRSRAYWIVLVVLGLGSLAVIAFFRASMGGLVDVATTLSFVSAPVLAYLNHRAVTGDEVPEEHRPARWLLVASGTTIVLGTVFAIGFIALSF